MTIWWSKVKKTEECEAAFQDLKRYLTQAPMLSAPEPGEDLFMYLSVSEHAVSAILLRGTKVYCSQCIMLAKL